MPSQTYEIKLDNVFEGPMDLLVHLIKKHEVDIYDIPIALITDQFLAYLEWMKALNVEVASDFLVMAATLAHIKSRMLLPRLQEDPADTEEEDLRLEIADQLMEYLQMKTAAGELSGRPLLEDDVFTRHPDKSAFLIDPGAEVVKTDLFELITAYHDLINRTSTDGEMRIAAERISVKDRMTEVINILEANGAVTLLEIIPHRPERMDIVVTFLAILEIVKLGLARLVQNGQSASLRLFYA